MLYLLYKEMSDFMSKLGNTLAMLKILETGRKYTVNI